MRLLNNARLFFVILSVALCFGGGQLFAEEGQIFLTPQQVLQILSSKGKTFRVSKSEGVKAFGSMTTNGANGGQNSGKLEEIEVVENKCREFVTLETPFETICLDLTHITWIAYGGGSRNEPRKELGGHSPDELLTTIVGRNSKTGGEKGEVQFTVYLTPAVPRMDNHVCHMKALFTHNRSVDYSLQIGEAIGVPLPVEGSSQIYLLHTPAGLDMYGNGDSLVPNHEKVSLGSAIVGYQARLSDGAPAILRGLPEPAVQFNSSQSGQLQAMELATMPAPIWNIPSVSATADHRAQDFSFAISNPTDQNTTLLATLTNQWGETIGAKELYSAANGTFGIYVWQVFPEMFSADEAFTGGLDIKVVSPSGGLVSFTGFQQTGNTISNVAATPTYLEEAE